MVQYPYNQILASAMLEASRGVTIQVRLKGQLYRMDILSSEVVDYKTCPNCHTSKTKNRFYRHNDWCSVCVLTAIKNTPEGTKFCLHCKEYKPLTEYRQVTENGKKHLATWCETCILAANRAKYDPRYARNQHLYSTYGITLEEYEAILEQQGGVCAICRQHEVYQHPRYKKFNSLVVDHNHKTGKVRAILCQHCNRTLGLLRDDIEFTKAVLKYLLEHQE